jgi:hypothetical protein
MTYTYDPTTTIGTVRLTIGDIPATTGGVTTAFFTDEEITSILTAQGNDTGKASVAAMRIWARRLSSKPKQQIGDYTYDPAVTAKNLMSAADALAIELDDEADDPVIGEVSGDYWVRD